MGKNKQANTHLRFQRHARCWTLQEVADRLYHLCLQENPDCAIITADTVGRWERGVTKTSKYYQQKLCLLFDKNALELGFVSTPPDARTNAIQPESSADGAAKTPLRESTLTRNKDAPVIVVIQNGDVSMIRIPTPQDGAQSVSPVQAQERDEMNNIPTRRDILEVSAELGATALLLPHALTNDEAERLSWFFEDAKALDDTALTSLERITQSYWHLLYGGSVPKGGLLKGVLGHRASIELFLHTAQSTAHEQRLSALVSQQAQMAGKIYFDLHDYPQAEQYFRLGMEAARHTANPTLYAVAVARTSFVYSHSHQFQEALSLLQVARRCARQSPTLSYWIAAVEAEVQAKLYTVQPEPSISYACLRALEEAEYGSEQSDNSVPSYGRTFGRGDVALEKGVCFRYLGRAQEAQAVLLAGLTTIQTEVPECHGSALIQLGSAYAQQGEVEEACTRATQALMLINQTKSAHDLQRLSDFRLELAPWAASSEVQSLDEQIMVVRLHLAPLSLTK